MKKSEILKAVPFICAIILMIGNKYLVKDVENNTLFLTFNVILVLIAISSFIYLNKIKNVKNKSIVLMSISIIIILGISFYYFL
ncbi:MAG: hypothetical protein EOO99_05425 [Pedobacter sp.]|nr:MAG: hypothetical protein EOO99_05425 [Pedobacter sp.]